MAFHFFHIPSLGITPVFSAVSPDTVLANPASPQARYAKGQPVSPIKIGMKIHW
ncbi:hypothetical protein DDI_3018 [Dickeya dianthicola RNS04.9]|nr:hypothetical protein DDI_3018 [Dickeya dianthicola RNS04.9]